MSSAGDEMGDEQSDGVVLLTGYEPADASVLADADADPEHRRRFEFPEGFTPSLRHSLEVIARWKAERTAGTRFAYAVRDVTGQLLGGVEILPVGNDTANLSYWTAPAHRRHGIASRAVALACRIAFADLRFRCLRVVVDPDNVASRRVAVRNGFREVGTEGGRVGYVKQAGTAEASTAK